MPLPAGTQVDFSLRSDFCDPGPYVSRLDVAPAGIDDEEAWCTVDTKSGIVSLTDPIVRSFGTFRYAHYRVVISTPLGEYVSAPTPTTGSLSFRDWHNAREVVRRESLQLRNDTGQRGFLLKRRIFGQSCSCVDKAIGESKDPQCSDCYGTGVLGGYYAPISDFYVAKKAHGHNAHNDAQGRGTIDEEARVFGRALNVPVLHSKDVFVEHATDNRWMIRAIKPEVSVRGVSVILDPVELRLLPFNDVVYSFNVNR